MKCLLTLFSLAAVASSMVLPSKDHRQIKAYGVCSGIELKGGLMWHKGDFAEQIHYRITLINVVNEATCVYLAEGGDQTFLLKTKVASEERWDDVARERIALDKVGDYIGEGEDWTGRFWMAQRYHGLPFTMVPEWASLFDNTRKNKEACRAAVNEVVSSIVGGALEQLRTSGYWNENITPSNIYFDETGKAHYVDWPAASLHFWLPGMSTEHLHKMGDGDKVAQKTRELANINFDPERICSCRDLECAKSVVGA